MAAIKIGAPHPESYGADLPLTPHLDRNGYPHIPPLTIVEMRAYCRMWGIAINGPVLGKAEVRTTPHPRCAYAHLPIARGRTLYMHRQQAIPFCTLPEPEDATP